MPLCNHLILYGHAEVFKNTRHGGEIIRQLLTRLVGRVGMMAFSPPYIAVFAPHTHPREQWGDTGIVAIVPLAESHISLHTFWETGAFNFDLFSCKPFDPEMVEDWLIVEYGMEITGQWSLKRNIGE